MFWVIVTFSTSSVKNTHQLYACRFLVRFSCPVTEHINIQTLLMDIQQVGLAEGTLYPAVHTVLGGWYTKEGMEADPAMLLKTTYLTSLCRISKESKHLLCQRVCGFDVQWISGSFSAQYSVKNALSHV